MINVITKFARRKDIHKKLFKTSTGQQLETLNFSDFSVHGSKILKLSEQRKEDTCLTDMLDY